MARREQGHLHVQSQHLLQDSQDQSSLNRKKNDISPCSHASLVPPHADAVLADDDRLTNAGYLRLTWHFPPWAARCKAYGGINKRNSHSRARRLSLQPCSSRNPCINVIKRYQNLSSYTELCCIKITIPCSPCQSATHHRLWQQIHPHWPATGGTETRLAFHMANVWLSSKSTVIIRDYDKSDTSNSGVNRQTSAHGVVFTFSCSIMQQISSNVKSIRLQVRFRPRQSGNSCDSICGTRRTAFENGSAWNTWMVGYL